MNFSAVTSANAIDLDIAVIGGGIAGLWLLNRLVGAGYNAVLLEQTALGSDQTLASQGMIHGGMKYTLQGTFSGASEAIAEMPAYWQNCLTGHGDVDLAAANILTDAFYFWSSGSIASRLTSFFASKAMSGRINQLPKSEYPALLNNPHFNGKVYRLQDIVVDVPSVIRALIEPVKDRLWKISNQQRWGSDNNRAWLNVDGIKISARQFVLTAGKGNAGILAQLDCTSPQMQLRPLQQVWVQHHYLDPLYGHCLGIDNVPRLSISSHPSSAGKMVWSLGGQLAEWGADKTQAEVIDKAKIEVAELFPWLDFSRAQWTAGVIERAEPKQKKLLRPDKAFAERASALSNVITAWPTKLTLAPNLANEVLTLLDLQPDIAAPPPASPFPIPAIAPPPWKNSFG